MYALKVKTLTLELGLTWSEPMYASELTDPVCEGSMAQGRQDKI